MSDAKPQRPDYTSIEAYVASGGEAARPHRATIAVIPWDQPATMIDLEGRVPVIATIRDCARHFALYKPHARSQARIVLTSPVHRPGRKTRTWILEPEEIGELVRRLAEEEPDTDLG